MVRASFKKLSQGAFSWRSSEHIQTGVKPAANPDHAGLDLHVLSGLGTHQDPQVGAGEGGWGEVYSI